MFLQGRLHQPLGNIDDTRWQAILERHSFLKKPGYSVDDEHIDLAFHILMLEGELAQNYEKNEQEIDFDSVPIPSAAFSDSELCELTWSWQEMHSRNFGPGILSKMGLYVVRSRGTLGFHVDGPVFYKGAKTDLSQPDIQRGMLEIQASHRTIMPLRFNPDDQFMICSFRAPLRCGELFEFSNVLPHAYFNRGPEDAVLLVTTYLSEGCLPVEVDYGIKTEELL